MEINKQFIDNNKYIHNFSIRYNKLLYGYILAISPPPNCGIPLDSEIILGISVLNNKLKIEWSEGVVILYSDVLGYKEFIDDTLAYHGDVLLRIANEEEHE